MTDVSTPAVLLKFDPNVMHHGGLGAIRSLGRMGVPVYAVQEAAWAPAAQSRYLHGQVLWQPSEQPAEKVLAGLKRLSERIGSVAVLIPTDDAGAIFLAEHGDELRSRFLFAAPPAGLPRQLAGKYSLHEMCARLGVPSPQACLPDSLAVAAGFAGTHGYPVIGKLATPWRAASGQLSTAIIGDRAGLESAWRASQGGGTRLMLQEFIPASPGSDWFFHGYCGTSVACKPACTGVKDRSYPAHAGLTSFGRCVPNAGLREQVTGLLDRLGYRGIVDLDLRRDDRDGQYKLLDFNPRLGAQFRLFTGPGGLDVVRAAYLDLTGQPVTGAEPGEGRSFMVESYDPMSAMSYWRRGELGLRSWLASVRDVDETAWFARDDLRPFGLMCLRMGWRVISRPLIRNQARTGSGAAAPSTGAPRLRRGRAGRAGARTTTAGQPATQLSEGGST
jgi:predicted ATP-grasp superfamily ATP-dependent carboligase